MKNLPSLFDSQEKKCNFMFHVMSLSKLLGFQDQILWGTALTTYEKHIILT